jgi:hypothetical protein
MQCCKVATKALVISADKIFELIIPDSGTCTWNL